MSLFVAEAGYAQCLDDTGTADVTVRFDASTRDADDSIEGAVTLSGEAGFEEALIEAGDSSTLTVPVGSYDWTASAAGFDARSGSISVCSDASLEVVLVPALTVQLRGTVIASPDATRLPAVGASVDLVGLDGRAGERFETVTNEGGEYTFESVPAGFYSLALGLETVDDRGRVTTYRSDLNFIDVLGDSQVDLRLISNRDQPDVDVQRDCSTSNTGSSAPFATLALIGLLLGRARRRDDE